jgi:hypothetical protein
MLDLAIEFDKELMDLGIRVSKLEKRVADLEEATSEKPAVSFYGEYKAEFKDYSYDKDGHIFEKDGKKGFYENPFNYKKGDDPDYQVGNNFNHLVDLNVKVEKDALDVDLNLNASKQGFGFAKGDGFTLDSITGKISGNGFDATVKKDQERGMKPYLFNGYRDGNDWKENKVHGVVVDTANGTYFLHGVEGKYAVAGSNDFDLLGGFNVVYGFEKAYDDLIDVEASTNVLFGVNKTFNLGNIEVTPEFAMNKGVREGKYFTLNAKGKLAVIDTTFNYKNIEEDFTSIVGRGNDEEKGFDVKGETSVGILDVTGYYEDYEQKGTALTYFTGEVKEENAVKLLGFNFFADGGYRSYLDIEDATSRFFNLNAKNSFGKLDVHGKLEYQVTTKDFADKAGDDFEDEADKLDKKLTLGYNFTDALKAGAKYTLDKNNDLTEHVYTVDYDKGIVTAGAKFELDEPKENHFYAGLNADKAESYDLLNVALTPYFEFKTWTEEDVRNIIAGVDARKAINEYADLVAGYEYYDSQKDLTDNDHDYYGHGTLQKTKLGVEYRITDDVKATADYKHLEFVANKDLNPALKGFEADLISAGVSVAF